MSSFSSIRCLRRLVVPAIDAGTAFGPLLSRYFLDWRADLFGRLRQRLQLTAAIQLLLHSLCQHLEDANKRPALIVSLDHRPWSVAGFRLCEHLLDCGNPFVVLGVVTAIILGNTPGKVRIGKVLLKPLSLFLLGDVQPELDHDLTVVTEPALEFVDLLVGLSALALLH